jgi:hypothetical protein
MGLGVSNLGDQKGVTLAEYVANLRQDKQEYCEADTVTDDYLDEPVQIDAESIELEHNHDVDIVDTLGANELADVLVNVFNVGYNVFARAFSQGYVNLKEFEARPDELATIRKPLAKYLKSKDIQMSPGVALLIAVLVVYAPKTFLLMNAKKQAIKELKQAEHAEDNNE